MFDNPYNIQSGNVAESSPEKTQFNLWSIGDFVKWSGGEAKLSPSDASNRFGLRYSQAIEVKWSHHAAGETRQQWAGPGTGFTLGILISGAFLERFRATHSEQIHEYRLEKPGDYIAWRNSLFHHTWQAMVESDFLTVRWWDADNPSS